MGNVDVKGRTARQASGREWWAGEGRANPSTRKVQRVNTNALPNSTSDIFHHVDHSYGHDSGTVSEDGVCRPDEE